MSETGLHPEDSREGTQWTVRHEPRHMLSRNGSVVNDVFDIEQDNRMTEFKIGRNKFIQAGAKEKKQYVINDYQEAETEDIKYLIEIIQSKIRHICETKEVLLATLQSWNSLDANNVPSEREDIYKMQIIIDGMRFYDGLTNHEQNMSEKTGEWYTIPGGSLANELYEDVYESIRPTGRTQLMVAAIVAEAGGEPLWTEEEKVEIKKLYEEHLDLQELIVQGSEVKRELEKYADEKQVPIEMRTDMEIRPDTIDYERARLIEQVKHKDRIIDYVSRFIQFLDKHLERLQPYVTPEKWSEIIAQLRKMNVEPSK